MSDTSRLIDMMGNPLIPSKMSTQYRSADTQSKEFRNWMPSLTSADSDLTFERDTLVSRNRDLERNNGLASGLAQTNEDSIIGVQFKLACRPDYRALGRSKKWAREWSKKTESLWRIYADSTEIDAARQLNFHGLTKVVLRSGLGGGEGLILPLWFTNRKTRTVFQLVDTDRLSTPSGLMPTATMRDGIEINQYDEPIAYNIRKQHPGNYWLDAGNEHAWQRIPARTRFGRLRVIHIFDSKRPGQHRAPPALTAMMGEFRMLDTYRRTELTSAISNSLISAILETSMSSEDIAELFNADSTKFMNQRAQWDAQLQAGAMITLFPGDKLKSFTPSRPATAYASYVENMLRTMAAGANIPYELLLKDFSKTNYSSARAAILEAWRFFLGRRKWLSDNWATPAYSLWLEEKVSTGEIEAPGFYDMRQAYSACRWIGGGRGWVDEFKEANSSKLRIAIGISTLQDECEVQGKDWEDVMEQRAVELAHQKELEAEWKVKFPVEKDVSQPNSANDSTSADEDSNDDSPEDTQRKETDDPSSKLLSFLG